MEIVCFVNNYQYGEHRFLQMREANAYKVITLDAYHKLVFMDVSEQAYHYLQALLVDRVSEVGAYSELGIVQIYKKRLQNINNKNNRK